MANRRPEREAVERLLQEDRRRKAHDIAGVVGLIDTMGYDKAVNYVREVRKSMKKSGAFPAELHKFASDKERLEDITKLYELRAGKMSKRAAYTILLLNCYYRYCSDDDTIHLGAIDDTYNKNQTLQEPLPLATAIRICEIALEHYMRSRDEEQNKAARKRGFPGAGLNYTSDTLIDKLEITDEELQHMNSIRRE